MKVLVACEESQAVCKAFREKGHNAFSCDILPCSGGHPEWHIQGDVLQLLNPTVLFPGELPGIQFFTMDNEYHCFPGKWDLIIAHPPCTYFSTAGANWLFRGGKLDEERYKKGLEMKQLFMQIYNADCPRICIENVVAMKIWELPPHTQEVQPWQFGHKVTKKTRLWLKNLPLLIPTDVVEPEAKWISCGNYKNRTAQNKAVCKAYNKRRSETFLGIAAAMAEQWSKDENEKEERKNEMELKVIDVKLPEQISFNYEELKAELLAKVSVYENMVYGEAQIKDAKADRANLNKLKKALNDERIRREKEYMQPFNDFKAKINEIINIIDKPVLMIDSQVKAYEEQQKTEKQIAIVGYFEGRNPFDWLKLEQIFNEKWLNATVKMPNITVEIDSAIEQIEKDLETLSNLPEFAFEAAEEYKRSLDLNKAISEGKRLVEIQKRKAEEQQKMNEAVEKMKAAAISAAEGIAKTLKETDVLRTTKVWISFKAHLTTEEALALRDFFDSRNIEFEAI